MKINVIEDGKVIERDLTPEEVADIYDDGGEEGVG